MAMAQRARGGANAVARLVAARGSLSAASPLFPAAPLIDLSRVALSPKCARPFSFASWRGSLTPIPSCGSFPFAASAIIRDSAAATPWQPIAMRFYSKRPKKHCSAPYAFVHVQPGVPCPPYSPNAGSVRKRNQKKRMAQRHAFAAAQVRQMKEQTKAAMLRKTAARDQRRIAGKARAEAWEKHLQEKQQAAAVPV